jgi:glycosyltransferase involved in cell wall biosynthesis
MNKLYINRLPVSPTILHVAPITDSEISGLRFSIPPSIDILRQRGINTGLLTTSNLDRYQKSEPYPVVYIKDLPRYRAIQSMPKPLNQPDLIIFHSTYILSHIPLVREAIERKIPYVIKPHGGMTSVAQQQKRVKKKIGNLLFFKWIVKNSAAIHCLTEQEGADVKEIWDHPVFIVGNGVDLPEEKNLANPGRNVTLRLVFLGRLAIEVKGLDLLLKACAIMQEDLRKFQVELFLYGPTEADSKTILNELITNYHLQDLIQIKDPVWGEEAKQGIFQSADVFVYTSRSEGHPMAVLEALAYGLPCLLTPGTRMATDVESAGAGWSVEPTPEGIATGIATILASRSEIPCRGQAARNFVEKKYTWEQIGKQSQAEYTRIIREHNATRSI